jgi:hypothetical protein
MKDQLQIKTKDLFKFFFERRLGYSILERDDPSRHESDDADLLIEIYRNDDITGQKFSLILYPTNTKTFLKDMKDALTGLYLDMEL